MARETYVYRDGKLILKNGDEPRRRSKPGIQIIQDIQPYKDLAVDGRIVGGRRQHRELLRANGLVELGNEPHRPRQEPPNRVDRGLINDIKRAMGKL